MARTKTQTAQETPVSEERPTRGAVAVRARNAQMTGIDTLIPYAHNARTHSPEQLMRLRESLRAYHQAHAQGDGLCREKEVSAAFRGHVCGAKYAEALKIVKFPDGGQDFLLRQLLGERFRWWGNAQYPAYGYLYF